MPTHEWDVDREPDPDAEARVQAEEDRLKTIMRTQPELRKQTLNTMKTVTGYKNQLDRREIQDFRVKDDGSYELSWSEKTFDHTNGENIHLVPAVPREAYLISQDNRNKYQAPDITALWPVNRGGNTISSEFVDGANRNAEAMINTLGDINVIDDKNENALIFQGASVQPLPPSEQDMANAGYSRFPPHMVDSTQVETADDAAAAEALLQQPYSHMVVKKNRDAPSEDHPKSKTHGVYQHPTCVSVRPANMATTPDGLDTLLPKPNDENDPTVSEFDRKVATQRHMGRMILEAANTNDQGQDTTDRREVVSYVKPGRAARDAERQQLENNFGLTNPYDQGAVQHLLRANHPGNPDPVPKYIQDQKSKKKFVGTPTMKAWGGRRAYARFQGVLQRRTHVDRHAIQANPNYMGGGRMTDEERIARLRFPQFRNPAS
ncbi:unnamed protein product [Amoebophrya sp. A120]|nr:unnamed protein product [Amoebophrya sp. A120]|eukprot:GSA120T00014636001.1